MIRRFAFQIAVALLILLQAFGVHAQDGQPAPENVEKLKKGIEHAQAGRGKEAMDLYNEVIAAEPKWEVPLLWRAQLWILAGRIQEAHRDADAAVTLKPDSSDALLLRAQCGIKLAVAMKDNPEGAKLQAGSAFKDASAVYQVKRAPATALLMMQAQFLRGRKEEAEKGFAALLKRAPPGQELSVRMMILGARLELHQHDTIGNELNSLIDLLKDQPQSAELLVVRAEIRAKTHHWGVAEQDLDEAIRRVPALKNHPKVLEVRATVLDGAPPRALWPMVELIRRWSANPADAATCSALAAEVEARMKDGTFVQRTFSRKNFLSKLPSEVQSEILAAHLLHSGDKVDDRLAELRRAGDAYERLSPRGKDEIAPLLAVAEKMASEAGLADAYELRGRIRFDAGDFAGAAEDYTLARFIVELSTAIHAFKPSTLPSSELDSLAGIAARLRDKKEEPEDRAYREGREFELRSDLVQTFERYAAVMSSPWDDAKSPQKYRGAVERRIPEMAVGKRDVLLRECKARAVKLSKEAPEEALRYLILMDRLIWRFFEGRLEILHEDKLTGEERAERIWNLNLQAELLVAMPDRSKLFLEVCSKVERLQPFDVKNHLRRAEYLERAGNLRQALFFYNAAIGGEGPDPKASDPAIRRAGQKVAELMKSIDPKEVALALSLDSSFTVGSEKVSNPNTSSYAGTIAACTVFLRNPGNNPVFLRKTRGMNYAYLKVWDKAVIDMEEAVRLDKEVYVAINLVNAYESVGRYQDALDEMARMDRIPSGKKSGYELLAEYAKYKCLRRATLELALKRYDRADQEIDAELRIPQKDELAKAQTLDVLRKRATRDSLQLLALKGDILLARGDKEGALKYWGWLIGSEKNFDHRSIGEKIKAAGGTNPYDEPKSPDPEKK